MSLYESVFIVRQDVSAAQVDSIVDAMTEVLTGQDGTVEKKEYWGLKNLAYRIKKNRKGHYVLLNIDAPADAIREYERNLRIHEDVMRFVTFRMDALEEGPSIQMQARTSRRSDRDRDRDRDRGRDRDRDRDRSEPSAEAATEPAKATEPVEAVAAAEKVEAE